MVDIFLPHWCYRRIIINYYVSFSQEISSRVKEEDEEMLCMFMEYINSTRNISKNWKCETS